MSSDGRARLLEQLLADARRRALKASVAADELVAVSRFCRERTQEVRRRSWEARAASRAAGRLFRLEGVIDGEPVVAVMRADGLMADDALLQRADITVALGEEFEYEDGSVLPASLEGPPTAILLTLIRACDRTLLLEMDLGRDRLSSTSQL